MTPTKNTNGDGFQDPFEAKILNKISSTEIELDKTVPDTFTINDNTKIVSNATSDLYFFHFVDHTTKDNEAAQYWSHEFTFWVQVWVDRLGIPEATSGTIQNVSTSLEDSDGNVIIEC